MIQMKKIATLGIMAILVASPLTLYAKSITPLSTAGITPPPQLSNSGKPLQGSAIKTVDHPLIVGTSTGGVPDSGPHGGRMMASDTRPLPPALEDKVMNREIGSTTGKNGGESMRGGMRGSTTENGEMIRERIGGHRGDIFHQAGTIIFKRMQVALERFTKLADRMDSRIAKMKASGMNTAIAEAGMVTVRSKLAEASKEIAGVDIKINEVASTIDDATNTPSSNDEKKPAKEAMEKAKQSLIAVQKALNDIVPLLLGEKEVSVREHASSTTASATPKLPGMMRTQGTPMPTTTNEHPDGTL